MNQPKFKRGDVVRLKSGGAKMTVNGYEKGFDLITGPFDIYENVLCIWQNGTQPDYGYYHADALELTTNLTSGNQLTTQDILNSDNQHFIYQFLFTAFMNNMHGMHSPKELWKQIENPKPDISQLETILEYLEGEKLIEIKSNSSFGDFDNFRLTDLAREQLTHTPKERITIGFKTNNLL